MALVNVDAELKVNRANTATFIAARPSQITLIPTVKVKTASGFTSSDGPARAVQTLRLVDQSTAFGPVPGRLRSAEGQQRKDQYQLVGRYDTVMELGDHWVVGSARYEIDELLPDNGYERRAKVIRYAQ